jgi:hypothetical protein
MDVDRAAFAAHLRLAVGQVEVLDVEAEHLGRPGCGLVQQPPQRLLPDGDVLASEQLLDVGPGQRAGAVGTPLAPAQC